MILLGEERQKNEEQIAKLKEPNLRERKQVGSARYKIDLLETKLPYGAKVSLDYLNAERNQV